MTNGSPWPSPWPGWLIVFEGVEGAGKTTQLELLQRELESQGYSVLVTREPGGTRVGEGIRSIVLDPDPEAGDGALRPRTEALLFAAARAQLVQQVIQPALERGQVVLSDRFVDSSLVYQGIARGLGRKAVETVNHFATGGLQPDLVVLLRLDAADGLARTRGRDPAFDRIEAEDLQFHRLVEQGFMLLADEHPERFAVIDAAQPVEQVAAEVRTAALERLSHPERLRTSGAPAFQPGPAERR